jgi:Na+-translocating ferredoxin:NAD+ oxidoreductase RnfG subunit
VSCIGTGTGIGVGGAAVNKSHENPGLGAHIIQGMRQAKEVKCTESWDAMCHEENVRQEGQFAIPHRLGTEQRPARGEGQSF